MTLKENILLEEVYREINIIKFFEVSEYGKVALPHYLHNNNIIFSQFFKKEVPLPKTTIEKIA